ncbi:MAG TPA: nitroreductase family protein [Solirubrobacteraceae bacterium]|nr:nitroreductase family protein [Solirubrobacteraceae bacterium]
MSGPEPPHDLYEVMRSAPSTRGFRPDPVPPEAVRRVLENARFAPSGGNRQPWRVIVVDDPGLRRRLGELYQPHWESYMVRMGARALLDQAGENPPGDSGVAPRRLAGVRAADEFAARLGEVPLHLVICVELASLAIVDQGLDRPSVVGGASIYPFVQNVLLGLRREGLGAAFTTLLTPAEAEVRELLGLPEGIALAGHIAVGYREGDWPRRLSRRPVGEFAFSNHFERPWVIAERGE